MAKTNKKTANSDTFAVIKTGAKQYRVSEGLIINIEKIKGDYKVGDKVDFTEVLLKNEGDNTVVGTPVISDTKVVGEIVEMGKGDKVVGMRYKQKSRSRNMKFGHRQPFFKVKIVKV